MARHLDACVLRSSSVALAKVREASLYQLRIEGGRSYWLDVELAASQPLANLDAFLRRIWLECCGHMSAFIIHGVWYQTSVAGCFAQDDVQSMNHRLSSLIREPGEKMGYEYDFGSTTALVIRLTRVRKGAASKDIRLLARNEPPPIECSCCANDAVSLCTDCGEDLCEMHGAEHECDAELRLPLVNSPRAGVCGYVG